MASITPGSGGTLKSTTYEGQILELAQLLETWESTPTNNPQSLDYVTVSHSGGGTTAISFNIPLQTRILSGQVDYFAAEYLTGVSFAPGSAGTLTDETAAGYFVELVQRAQILEAQQSAADRINGSININNLRFSGSVTVVTAIAIANNGAISINAVEYLT